MCEVNGCVEQRGTNREEGGVSWTIPFYPNEADALSLSLSLSHSLVVIISASHYTNQPPSGVTQMMKRMDHISSLSPYLLNHIDTIRERKKGNGRQRQLGCAHTKRTQWTENQGDVGVSEPVPLDHS